MSEVRERGILTAVYGKSGTGKGVWVIYHELAKKNISLVWDLKGDKTEYTGATTPFKSGKFRCYTLSDLKIAVAKISRGVICYSGSGGKAEFQEFCQIARDFTRIHGARGAVVIDETSSVTNPGKASDTYGDFIRMGLNMGSDIYVICQRGAESDSTAQANASRIHFSAPGRKIDMQRMHDDTGVPIEAIEAMVEDHDKKTFDYIDVVTGNHWRLGRLSLPEGKGTPRFRAAKQINKL